MGRIVVLCTVGTREDAERIARDVVGSGLAACVNIVGGVVSVYRWKGRVEKDTESLLVVKTRSDRFEALRNAITALHPYDVPEIIALPIEAGHEDYLAWIDESVKA